MYVVSKNELFVMYEMNKSMHQAKNIRTATKGKLRKNKMGLPFV